ncbi:MAG TPA: hypothetical protein VNT81_09440 [Vicinamibacterales bacterium]|nr:hypothetical protein [Vicinamibacterales bacterium]
MSSAQTQKGIIAASFLNERGRTPNVLDSWTSVNSLTPDSFLKRYSDPEWSGIEIVEEVIGTGVVSWDKTGTYYSEPHGTASGQEALITLDLQIAELLSGRFLNSVSTQATLEQYRWRALYDAIERGRKTLNMVDSSELMISTHQLSQLFDTAESFARLLWRTSLDRHDQALPTPIFTPLLEGSIDLYFRTDTLSLCINFEDSESLATFAGERADSTIGGTISTESSSLEYLAAWLLAL